YLADFRLGGFDLRDFGGNGDLLALRGDFQSDVNRGGLADGENNSFVDEGGEASERDGQLVLPGGQVRYHVEPRVVRSCRVAGIGGGFAQGKGGALHGGSAFVADGTVQLRDGDLGEGRIGAGE